MSAGIKHAKFMRWVTASIESNQITEKQFIGCVDRWWNFNIKYVPDKKDDWQTPEETLNRGAGDCEDIAIGKFFDLHTLGSEPHLVYALTDESKGHLYCSCMDMKLDNQTARVTDSIRFDVSLASTIRDGKFIGVPHHPFALFPKWERVVLERK